MSIAKPNLPNSLTLFRILVLPWCAYALFKNGGNDQSWRIVAWASFFLVGLTDIFDGKLARSRKQITSFGTFLDPVADKLAIGTAMIGLSIQGKLAWWVTVLILFREISITIMRLLLIKRKGVIPASKGGKLKTFFIGFGVGFYILPLPQSLYLARDLFMAIGIILAIVTGIDYLKKALSK
jgi:CDP-diacylglycerol---glycerol-3-phosphate 3-phosphatidyltransferase